MLGFTLVAAAQPPVDLSRQSAGGATADWPQWQGPDRTGLSKETGLLQQWPPSGPPAVWSISGLGAGYGSVAVKGDRIFVQALHAAERTSTVASLNRADGKVVWRRSIGRSSYNDRGPGPRGTPTIDDDRLYILTESGDLACLAIADGTIKWQRNILADFGGRQIPWLISESPLVDGGNVIVTPGGPRAGIAALDKMTGKTVWTSQQLSDEAGYASPIAADVQSRNRPHGRRSRWRPLLEQAGFLRQAGAVGPLPLRPVE